MPPWTIGCFTSIKEKEKHLYNTFGIYWVLPGKVADLLFSWWNGLGRNSLDIWNIIPICLMWTIWKEHNQRTFQNVSQSDNKILEGFTLTLFDWSRAWGLTTSTSISVFLSSLSLNSHDVIPLCVSVHTLCTPHSFLIKFCLLPIKKKKNLELCMLKFRNSFWLILKF
jgi:hypothetical protein